MSFSSLASKAIIALMLFQLTACSTTQTKPVTVIEKQSEVEVAASTSGFGGTGRTQDEPIEVAVLTNPVDQRHSKDLDSGFGGTGHTSKGFGGTGVIGTLEQFGSIWVNGIEIGLGQKTKISSNLPNNSKALTVSDLRIGQQVWLETHPDQDKTTTAEIHIYYPLAGQIDEVKLIGMATEILVNGQRIYISPETKMAEKLQLKVGEFVRISGMPVYAERSSERSNTWQATLVEQHAEGETWYKTVPSMHFSENVNRVMMHDSWLKSYHAGEFKQIPAGLSSTPKIKMHGQEGSTQGNVVDKNIKLAQAGNRVQRVPVTGMSFPKSVRTPAASGSMLGKPNRP